MAESGNDARISRRGFLAGLGGLAAAASLGRAGDAGPRTFDNLVLVCVDDLNDWISVLRGHPNARTPNIDRIAAEGLVFTDAHVAAPICNPSRTATWFATSPRNSGVYFNGQDWRDCSRLANRPGLFRHLRAQGLVTVGTGKVHHGKFQDPESWTRFRVDPEVAWPRREFPFTWYLSNEGEGIDWGIIPDSEKDFRLYDDLVGAFAEEELELLAAGRERFALNVGFYRPHMPWFVPERFYRLFPLEEIEAPFSLRGDLDDVPATGRSVATTLGDEEALRDLGSDLRAVRAYLAAIAYADEKVGRLYEAWKATPGRERSAFVLWSDNGFHLGEKEAWRKFTLWHESTRVPFVVVAPGLTRPGDFCRRPVSLLSLYATICELLGLEVPPHCEGPSLLPLLADPERDWPSAAVSVLGRQALAVRTERWCFIRYRDGEEELYDRRRDPNEYQNLAAIRDERLKAELLAMAPAEAAPYDPAKGSELAAKLGLDD